MLHGSVYGLRESHQRPRKRVGSPLDIGISKKQKIEKERGPRIFIFNCHSITFKDKSGKIAIIDPVAVDTFTTAKFGCPFGVYMYNIKTSSFFDEPYDYFIEEVLKKTKGNPYSLQKDILRQVISESLCSNRDVTGFIPPDKCKIRCHQVGRQMADMYMMTPGAPMNEVILSVDPFTGEEEDVHENFGLMELKQRGMIYPSVVKKVDERLDVPISKAESELEDLRSQISTFSQQKTPENMEIVRELQKKYDKKFLKLGLTREVLKGAVQGPKYVFKPEYRHMYDIIEGSYYVIKLSDMIKIAIQNGTINPLTDFVLVEACRTFYGELPSDYDPTKSPGRADSEPDSQGGGMRRTHSRKKYGKNKRKNKKSSKKNKRKTIRKLKLSKSRKCSS
jgi:hypothetical protein